MSLLSKLTIIIPTYNRQNYAKRNMRYWSGSEVTLIVVDGSKTSIPSHSLKEFSLNVQYYHLDASSYERFIFGIRLIKTDYAMFCGDDEFMMKSGLIACLEFLEKNSDYSVCIGRCIGFLPQKNRIRLYPVKEHHKKHNVNQDEKGDRIDYHMRNYMVTTIYGVHRVESFKYCFETTSLEVFTCAYIQETLIELLAVAFGKSKVLPNVTWMRSAENRPIQTNSWNRNYYISDWYTDPKMKEERVRLRVFIKTTLKQICSCDEFDKVFSIAVRSLDERIRLDKAALLRIQQRKNNLIYKAKLFLERGIYKIFRLLQIYIEQSYFISKNKYSYKYLTEVSEIIIDTNELNDLMGLIFGFHRNFRKK